MSWCVAYRMEAVRRFGHAPVRAPRSEARRVAAMRAAETRRESDDEVRRNLDGKPDALALWERVKHTICATTRATRTEVFEHWMHDHPAAMAEVWAAQMDVADAWESAEQHEDRTAAPF